MLDVPQEFLPTPNYPTYPPYHKGLYLEDYFINFWKTNQIQTERIFIPISWTSYYNNGLDRIKLQNFLNSLPKNKKYFVVSTHDDAPSEILPNDTLIFSAGGNIIRDNVIPIPLICSKLNINPNDGSKDIFCSFVGSSTHPIRTALFHLYSQKYYFSQNNWTPTIPDDKLNTFINISMRSKFCLCPRGYGPTSFRLYEIMQLGSVPVYVSDRHYLPWKDEINWNDIAILISPEQIKHIDEILHSIDDTVYQNLILKIKLNFEKYFSMDGVCLNILKRLK